MNRATDFIKLPKVVAVTKDVYMHKLAQNPHTFLLRTMATQRFSLICSSVLPRLRISCVTCVGAYSDVSTKYNRNCNISSKLRVYSTSVKNQKIVLESSHKVSPTDAAGESKAGPWRKLLDACDPYVKLARMDKPIGTWLLFWPCSWSIALAAVHGGVPPDQTLRHLALFLAGSFVMRGAGCTINDMWDKDIDKKVARTKDRPLVSGALTERQALVFLAAQLSAGLAILLQLNWYSVALGASSMALVVTYPLAKRFTNYPQLFLGATFNWGALLGWSAQLGELSMLTCGPLYAGALCWSVVYDTIYAHQDKEDDARIGMKSTALTFGAHTRPALAAFATGTLGGVGLAGYTQALDAPFYMALAVVAAHLARQIYTLRPDEPADCARKFKSNSLVGLIILLGIVGGGWRRYRDSRDAENAASAVHVEAIPHL